MQIQQTSGSEGIEFARQALLGDYRELAQEKPASLLSACSELIFRVTGERIPPAQPASESKAPSLRRIAQSEAIAALSPHGAKMFLTALSIAFDEGDDPGTSFSAQYEKLRLRGWRSESTAAAAVQEILSAGLLECVSRGAGRRPSAYRLNCSGAILPKPKVLPVEWNKTRPRHAGA